MKSPMVTNLSCITDKEGYSDLQVLKSPAGYYIGTMYKDAKGFQEPGSRDSDYFDTKEAAEQELKSLLTMDEEEAAASLRDHP